MIIAELSSICSSPNYEGNQELVTKMVSGHSGALGTEHAIWYILQYVCSRSWKHKIIIWDCSKIVPRLRNLIFRDLPNQFSWFLLQKTATGMVNVWAYLYGICHAAFIPKIAKTLQTHVLFFRALERSVRSCLGYRFNWQYFRSNLTVFCSSLSSALVSSWKLARKTPLKYRVSPEHQ